MRYPVGSSNSDFLSKWYNAQPFGSPTSYGFHEGDDFNLKTGGDSDLGQPLYAVADGKIVYYHNSSHPTTGFGKHMVLECETERGKRWYHYCHCQEISEGKTVKEGDIIGKLGKSGTTAAHLHFSVFKVDPSTLAQGIDTIAKTSVQLNNWEKFELLNTSMPENLEDRLKKDFGVKTLDELKSVWDKEMGFLKDARDKVKQLEQELKDQKAVTKTQTDALKASQQEFSTYVDNLVEILAPDPKQYKGVAKPEIVRLEIERLLGNESALVKQISDLEKQVEAVQVEKQAEIDQLKKEIDQLRVTNEKQQNQIERLSDRLEKLEEGSSILPPEKSGILEVIMEFINKLLKR